MKTKAWIKKIIRSLGFDVISADTSREFLLAGNLRELFQRIDIGMVLDIGANNGRYYDFLRDQVPFNGPIVSFEPIPELARRLQKRASQAPNWDIHAIALGANCSTGKLNIASHSEVSSFLKFNETAQHLQIAAVENVEINTINNLGPTLFKEIPPERTFIKLDTQGFDLEVLKGSSEYIDRIPILTTEIPFLHIYENMPSYLDYFSYLKEHEFDLVGMWPTSRDRLFRAREFDCLYINARLAFKDGES